MKFYLLTFCSAFFFSATAQRTNLYTSKNFFNLYDEFEYKRDLLRFLDIKKGDVIADVGAGEGHNDAALSLLYDSVTFYIEDINPKVLNQKKLNKQVKKYTKKKVSLQTNTFRFVIGTYTSTNLPDGFFDKILMIASFHEFTQMDEMIADLAKKLKPRGKIYILEAFSLPEKTIYCEDHHKGYRIEEAVEIMKKQGFYLTKMKSPESNIVDYTNCLSFEKAGNASNSFYTDKTATDVLLQETFRLNEQAFASDSTQVRKLTDSLIGKLTALTHIYIAFECWLKNIGLKYMKKKEYEAAINIFKVNIQLFPGSHYNYYQLGKAYKATKQSELARLYFGKAKALDSVQ
ncbi:MAG: methyltransferase domain-containing protein [Bacteroidia bacterium]